MPPSKPNLKNMIGGRSWDRIRDSWLSHIPEFAHPGARPDPGLENLASLQQITLPESRGQFSDAPGLRTNLLSEAVFLFHKCAHTHLAAQRLGTQGMHSWSMFNAYHSAYLGARGIMALLGIGLPYLAQGGQLLIDVHPEPSSKKDKRRLIVGSWVFDQFLLIRLGGGLDQSGLWSAFQRTLNVSTVSCWKGRAYDELLDLPDEITRPRNAFLYKAAFWPGEDLLADGSEEDFANLAGTDLSTGERGFLLRLSYDVYWLFDQLINDLADASGPIRAQINGSRILNNPNVPELACYNTFIAGFGASSAAQ